MANIELYLCEKCKQIAEKVVATQVPLICCGEEMKKLEAGTVDAAQEKHVPDVTREGNHIKVQVGSTLHPMEDKHYIQFIIVKQGDCTYRADLKPGQEPVAEFDIQDGAATVYEYCNLHGLWKADC
ncbi:MAG: desulfoferrodoxin family protein [Fastidiosipilaceae bacterium]|jgi:superoxide reductase|nr:desulfoferrodoxin [Clostridiaceae bacterium]